MGITKLKKTICSQMVCKRKRREREEKEMRRERRRRKGKEKEANFSLVDGSAKWEEFLEFLGTKVQLQGWQGFSGGLDTHHNTTGEHTIFASWG